MAETPPCEPLKVRRRESVVERQLKSKPLQVDCKYHVVFIPKCRRKTLYVELRKHLGDVFHELAAQKDCRIVEGHLMADHVHMLICIPPKHSVATVVGFIKGKSAIHIARSFVGKRRNFTGQNFWRGGTTCRRSAETRPRSGEYIRKQEAEDKQMEQMQLWAE